MKLERAGDFRGQIVLSDVKAMPDGTPQIHLRVLIDDEWRDGEWVQSGLGLTVDGWFNLMKKDGSPNDRNIAQLAEAAGWDGTCESVHKDGLAGRPVQVNVKLKTTDPRKAPLCCIEWLNAYDSVPGQRKAPSLSLSEVKSLDARFGGLMRAVGGKAFTQPKAPAVEKGEDTPF
jgi:hypothetical protein